MQPEQLFSVSCFYQILKNETSWSFFFQKSELNWRLGLIHWVLQVWTGWHTIWVLVVVNLISVLVMTQSECGHRGFPTGQGRCKDTSFLIWSPEGTFGLVDIRAAGSNLVNNRHGCSSVTGSLMMPNGWYVTWWHQMRVNSQNQGWVFS